jgi:carboxyl-terminal processing protease
MKNNSPIVLAAVLFLGFFIGKGWDRPQSTWGSRINQVLDQIEQLYVDSVDRRALEDAAVEAIVAKLDPHTIYFTEEELAEMAEPMEGGFEGIGVEFIISDDTLMVVNAIPGGPSERAGIRGGDRIVAIEGEEISGPELNNSTVMSLLKGNGGTKVNLGLLRASDASRYNVQITRARIPIHSVVASFILEENVGYIKVIRFAATTAVEFSQSLHQLARDGATSVIVDLRSNGGGYLHAATDMIDRFLLEDLDIVYTEGKAAPRITYKSTYDGEFSDLPIAILIDENSASASEIFAGAIQDNDRGLILGRRSFGKGLVQEEYSVKDDALRLTVARFYTPSGRAIQKPYGEGIDYALDHSNRLESGELYSADNISQVDSAEYFTSLGRTVYGGGGITPDVFIPLDTSDANRVAAELVWVGAMRDGAFEWIDFHRGELGYMRTPIELEQSDLWKDPSAGAIALMKERYKEMMGVEPVWSDEESKVVEHRFLAQVSRTLFGEEEYYKVISRGDRYIERALYEMLDNRTFSMIEGRLYLLPAKADSLETKTLNIIDNGI